MNRNIQYGLNVLEDKVIVTKVIKDTFDLAEFMNAFNGHKNELRQISMQKQAVQSQENEIRARDKLFEDKIGEIRGRLKKLIEDDAVTIDGGQMVWKKKPQK